ncbi:GNAT family N-acetyltransferase [Vibrio rumoiensis]|uniref:Acyltransferase MbtK/IucB-like conserved domain-containing protein n=1 Tax=Vibrio rumoiensis 1S-45 TaxID=1188252 RepID=A0A1E5DZG9_9VIBR|nr:GNAT family N-acetyltransferase [Vibrio rumoiensis]OEF23398.1 hypothetical protein A1QC_12035 [Vibrio rumoiensis 1S-45]
MQPDRPFPQHHPLSLQSFFNSFAMETDACTVKHNTLFIPVKSTQLALPLSFHSQLGRHRYQGEIFQLETQNTESNGRIDLRPEQRIDFPTAIQLLVDHYFSDLDSASQDRFFNRVGESDSYIRHAQQALSDKLISQSSGFIASEQALIGGHSMHPAPKSCEPLSRKEQHAYLPEFSQSFSIEWFAVHPDYVVSQGVQHDVFSTMKQLLMDSLVLDCAESNEELMAIPNSIEQGWLALPMHPLQAQAWRESKEAKHLAEHVIDCQLSTQGWTATSSSRAIYHPKLNWMLKVSLPVKLTNSLRLLTEKEAKRGIQFSQLLDSNTGKEMLQRMPTTEFLQEPVWCSIQNQQGECLDLPLVCLRENVFYNSAHTKPQSDKAANTYLLATVNQNIDNSCQIGTWVKQYSLQKNISIIDAANQWLSHFLDNVIEPLCIARSDYGIVLLAHQQNILLEVSDNLPIGMKYRDCQGIGLTDIALNRFSSVFNGLKPEYFVQKNKVNPYLAYYLIGNTLLNTITAIAADHGIKEQLLWRICQHKFSALRQAHPKDSSFYDYLLDSPTLYWKRNFLCFLSDFNEATLPDPSKIYCDISNPFFDENDKKRVHKPITTERNVCIELNASIEDNSALVQPAHQSFTVYEFGQKQAEFDVVTRDDNIYFDANIEDPLLWWSALEHAFYAFKTDKVTSITWPSFAQQHIANDGSMQREVFLQASPIWHLEQTDIPYQAQTATNGISHPLRPQKPVGQVFQRYCYHLKRTLTFRVIDADRDLEIFHQWHNHPLIHPIWELEGSLSMHREYLAKLEQDPHQFAVIGEFDGVPFGYFEVYWTPEDRLGPYYDYQDYDRGVHILVGNFDYRGGTFFDAWGKSILHYCYLSEPKTMRLHGEPNAKNHRVVKLTERIGMQKQFEFDFPHKRAALLQCERGAFFSNIIF